jgi:hypothetical protein
MTSNKRWRWMSINIPSKGFLCNSPVYFAGWVCINCTWIQRKLQSSVGVFTYHKRRKMMIQSRMKFMLSDNCPTVVPNGTRDESDLLRFAGLIKKIWNSNTQLHNWKASIQERQKLKIYICLVHFILTDNETF